MGRFAFGFLIATLSGCVFPAVDPDCFPPFVVQSWGDGVPGVPHRIALHEGFANLSCPPRLGRPWPPTTGCVSEGIPVTEILDVSCDGCEVQTAEVTGGFADVTLLRTEVGTATLHARIRLADGSEREDEERIPFVEPTSVRLACGGYPELATCPGEGYGTFTGAEWTFVGIARGLDDGVAVDLDMPVTATLEGTAVEAMPSAEPTIHRFVAREPGTARIRFSARDAERVIDVRVATPDEVTAVELLRSTSAASDVIGAGSDPMSPRVTDESVPTSVGIASGLLFHIVSTLSDGSRVIGGPATFESSQPSVLIVEPAYREIGPADGWWELVLRPYDLGSATVTVRMGSAMVMYPVAVVGG
jgi:hypothetical protein